MKVINLAELVRSQSQIRQPKSLCQIADECKSSATSLNPYTIAARTILKKLSTELIFPYLQPNVVNPLRNNGSDDNDDEDGGPRNRESKEKAYYRGTLDGRLFPRLYLRDPFGMGLPEGVHLCVNNRDEPFFVTDQDICTRPGVIDYRVYDLGSLQDFISGLARDMAILHPIKRSDLQCRSISDAGEKIGHAFAEGDIVFIPRQGYGKLGIVAGTKKKDYLAELFTPEGFHAPIIGVDMIELAPTDKMYVFDREFTNMIGQKGFGRVDRSRLCEPARLPLGSAAVLAGKSLYKDKEADHNRSPLGVVAIRNYNEECADVLPVALGGKDAFPWGEISRLAIPTSHLIYVGSTKKQASLAEASSLIADNREAGQILSRVVKQVLGDKALEGITMFCSIRRYEKLHQDLQACPNIPNGLVPSQFVHLLTKHGLDGIEQLARISDTDPVELAIGLLGKDYEHSMIRHSDGLKQHGTYVTELQDIVKGKTEYRSLEEMLHAHSKAIGLYMLPRDGSGTLAIIEHFQLLNHILYLGRANTLNAEREQDRLQERHIDSILADCREGTYKKSGRVKRDVVTTWTSNIIDFLPNKGMIFRLEDIPTDEMLFSDRVEAHFFLTGVCLRILLKDNLIRYGRDRNLEMQYPQLIPVPAMFKIDDFAAGFQVEFMERLISRLGKFAEFKGKKAFIASHQAWYKSWKARIEKAGDADGRQRDYRFDSEYHEFSTDLLDEIRPLYSGIMQLTSSPELRMKIVNRLFEGKPLLTEAYYDYEAMQKLICVRDHYWRGNAERKKQYLSERGYVAEISESAFANQWYAALAELDEHHRGFKRNEKYMHGITRQKTERMPSEDNATKSRLGVSQSKEAAACLENVVQRFSLITEGARQAPSLLQLDYHG